MKFMHLRPLKKDSEEISPKGGKTLCYEVNVREGKIYYSVARCHPDDHYVKRTGRDIALNRFLNDQVQTIPLSSTFATNLLWAKEYV